MVSQGGGANPNWRADGKELYWKGPEGELMAAPIDLQPSVVHPGKRGALFRLPSSNDIEPSADGRRFLLWDTVSERIDPPMVVVMNWAAHLEK